jgi:acetyl-CoA carboxylase biotin carboxyl carrier protein
MNFNEMKELIILINQSELTSFQYQKDGLKFKIEKSNGAAIEKQERVARITPSQSVVCSDETLITKSSQLSPSEITQPVVTESSPSTPNVSEGYLITSPLVGVYYASPNPTSPSFIEVGQKVKKGDVLCIVEAMKVMNEINAEKEGTILEIYLENESVVEYGQTIVRIG